jgi:predicted HTH transcriptional regulator
LHHHEAAISFLNSPKGGQIIIGVEDETFEVRGIDRDLQQLDGSEAKLKDAILDHIRNMLQEGLPLPSIAISIEPVEADKKVIYIDVPPGDYKSSLYKNNKGIAFIRMDGSKKTVKNVLEQDEFAQQRLQSRGPWAVGE